MKDQDIPGLVKRIRERMGLTQEQFAREVGVSFSTVNQWENGRRRPQPYLLNRLLEMLAFIAKSGSVDKRHSKPRRRTT